MLSPGDEEAIRLTLVVAVTAVAISLPFAIATAWLLAKRQFFGKTLLEAVVNLPLVLPPVVTGYVLLVVFGRSGPIGGWLERWFGLQLVFDWKGAAVAAAVVGFPLLVRPIRQGLAAVDDRMVHVALTLGATPFSAFRRITLPMARPGIVSGCLLAFARSMGEFGATIMIAGNIPGQTRTITLAIYTLLDAPQGADNALGLVLVSIAISAVALFCGEWIERRSQVQ